AAGGFGGGELKLEMLDESDLEESLAVTNMVQKIRNNCHEQLFAIEKRVASMLGVDELKADDNPIGPDAICKAFKDACSVVQTNVEVKLIILKLFDRHVASEVEAIYSELNQHLIAKGVLPEIKTEVVKRSGAGAAARKRAEEEAERAAASQSSGSQAAPAGGGQASADLMNVLQQIIGAGDGQAAAGPAQLTPRHMEVLGNLTALQHGRAPQSEGALPAIDPELLRAGNTNVLRELKSSEMTAGMGRVDVIMFDVVAMMFDYILDDRNVPSAMKALIGRLQIPVLKISLIDKGFFSRKNHPARKLLNRLAQAATGWDEAHDEGGAYYKRIEYFVKRILDEFEDSLDVFGTVLEELEKFLETQAQTAQQTTQSSTQAITERTRLAQARERSQTVITESLRGKPVPDVVQKFFQTRWKELLVYRHYEEGEEGTGWREAVQTMQHLIWSLVPKSTAEDRKKLLGLLPGLLNRVKAGMEHISLPVEERKHFLATLANHHLSAVRSAGAQSAPPAPVAPPELPELPPIERLLKQAVARANTVIHRAAESKPECAGMGTTLVAARFHNNKVTVAHVGDSRLYRLREGGLKQLTLDHSLMQELIAKGFYTPEEARKNVKSNIITRAVGVEESVAPDVQEIAAAPGDVFLLCSDGLHDMVEDDEIRATLVEHEKDLVRAAECLIDLANEHGGKDNISVVLARVVEPFPAEANPGTLSELEGKLVIAGKSDVGKRRSHNEDGIAIDPQSGIAMVADGMGGCNAGEVASAMAVEIIMRALRDEIEGRGADTEDELAWLEAAGDDAASLPELTDFSAEQETVDERYLAAVRELGEGDWIEFSHADGTTTRGRLAWMSEDTGRYLFTDIEGAKVADATLHGLALEMQRGNITVIEDEPLLDRVMTNVTDRLKSGETVH
ncbi:MAG: DUF1631 family protein, partial [Gammaproteobacteria bacterium]|nr:DUF1631 family protein [Gammaproteobacteria bacterium]